MNFGVHMSLSILVSSVCMLQWDCWVIWQFYFQVFKGISTLFSIVAVLVCIPTNSVRGFPFLHILSSIYCLQTFFSFFFFVFYQLEANYFTILQWVLSYIDMNQPQIYMYFPSRSPLPPQHSYPFICQQTSRLFPCPGYNKQCCDEHWVTRVSFRSGFLGVWIVFKLGENISQFFSFIFISWGLITSHFQIQLHSNYLRKETRFSIISWFSQISQSITHKII